MGTLLTILLVLFVTLAIIVKVTEKYGKPLEPEQQARLSKAIVFLIVIGLIVQAVRMLLGH